METLLVNLLDEVCKNTKRLCDYWDTTTRFATWAPLMQSSNIFAVLFLTLSSTELSSWSDNSTDVVNGLQKSITRTNKNAEKHSLTRGTLLSSSRLVNKTCSKNNNIQLWINLCPGWDLQIYKDNNKEWVVCHNFSIHFLKPWGKTGFLLQS